MKMPFAKKNELTKLTLE